MSSPAVTGRETPGGVVATRRSPRAVLRAYQQTRRFATNLSEDSNPERTALPNGYHYSVAEAITAREIARLWDRSTLAIVMFRRTLSSQDLDVQNIGVRSETSRLVGLGSIAWAGTQGELGNLIVEQDHRGQGIGKAILDERLRIAETHGIESLYIAELFPTNNLVRHYVNAGFIALEGGGFGRGPAPTQIVEI